MHPEGGGRRPGWQDRGDRDRGGFGGSNDRGGFGGGRPDRGGAAGGRQNRGRDKTPVRGHVWHRKQIGEERQHVQDPEVGEEGEIQRIPTNNGDDSKWEVREEKKEGKADDWGPHATNTSGKIGATAEQGKKTAEVIPATTNRMICEICGYNNHSTRECRRMLCERCGCNTHRTYDCVSCLPWHYGPELCATQVEGQSFFHMDEIIDTKVARDKASMAVISVVKGKVSGKDIEHMFMNLLGADAWRWSARPMNETTFALRFPNPKMVIEWSNIKYMAMKGGEAQIQIDPWSSSGGSKGSLQQGWFRVSNIPDDQRSVITLAKIGGLVGKVTEIDEKSRFRVDFVRLRIACRDVSKVPRTAEGVLGMAVYDFGFEREIAGGEAVKTLKSGIVIGDDQPPQKKSRADIGNETHAQNKPTTHEDAPKSTLTKSYGKQVTQSAPSKMQHKVSENEPKLMRDAQKRYKSKEETEGNDKVFIPEVIEESESDSDSFGERLRKLNETGQSSKQVDRSDQVGYMQMIDSITLMEKKQAGEMFECFSMSDKEAGKLSKGKPYTICSDSPEIFMADDSIIQSQESQSHGDNVTPEEEIPQDIKLKEVANEGKKQLEAHQDRRRSERLKKDTTLTTKEKNEKMAKKRNLEGLLKEGDKEMLIQGVDTMIKIATHLLSKTHQADAQANLMIGPAEEDDSEQDQDQ